MEEHDRVTVGEVAAAFVETFLERDAVATWLLRTEVTPDKAEEIGQRVGALYLGVLKGMGKSPSLDEYEKIAAKYLKPQ